MIPMTQTLFGLFDEVRERRKGNWFVESICPAEGGEAANLTEVPILIVKSVSM